MPSSQGQSWWARHCTPRPPINKVVACPCHYCYNKPACELDYPESSNCSETNTPAQSRPVSPRGRTSSSSSFHVEKAEKQ
ncbi:hypothetical protein THAR02_07391 [Trichoderma harzianum]|uniref:Uncharacterized protein n=4 Tax=Trichoderma TaxID=5543 RepID=A0A0G0A5R9_TRIHA|nr:hypothetical protein T069G_00955 [Trichoderma breve]KAF3077590.1 hypothetical protein CFAM422_000838 [Trichoderma lentiforme]KAJ4864425.1 hypothetical protein T069G_00955 [Trichoderma breve]KKP00514.1 hypothetical protein THAR02_07391 [Trichoderma harzianum]QYS94145.1 hypothetical protein H0G86_001494 [Trichoderma simmonsii]